MSYDEISRSNIRLARTLFSQNRPIPEGLLRRKILESWERSRSYGLQFNIADKQVISEAALKERIAERYELFELAVPVMERLYAFASEKDCLCTLSDEEGYVLKAMGRGVIMEAARKNLFVEGCNRHERRLGTNGIGTALVTHEPIQVFAEEHYYEYHHHCVCSGAPILDPAGKPLGIFCMTCMAENVSLHTLGMVAAAADSITQQIAMQTTYAAIERIQHHMKVIVETVPSGILLCKRSLEITLCNTQACALLRLPENKILGRKLHELLNHDPFDPENLHDTLNDKNIIVKRNGRVLHFIFTLNSATTKDYVITFIEAESFQKKIRRFIGSEAHFTFDDILGDTPAISNTVALSRIAAANDSTILLVGASGTGKELFAQAIHNASKRHSGPFVALNCGSLPKSLIESELFGYEGGSFTGARQTGNLGKFELANGGTIFLDEIGDMPFDVQASLLRVLQNREVTRLGHCKATKVDVRVIAATNKDLAAAIKENAFRVDLYYRLNVFNIRIPSLHERRGDIRLLADYFLRKYSALALRPLKGFTEAAYLELNRHPWPGNVRELENIIERAVYISRSSRIGVEDLHLKYSFPVSRAEVVDAALGEAFRKGDPLDAIKKAFGAANGNARQAASLLGISRRTLYRRVAGLGLIMAELRTHK